METERSLSVACSRIPVIEPYPESAKSILRFQIPFFKDPFNIMFFLMPLSPGYFLCYFLRYNSIAELAACFMLVSFLTYSLTLKMEVIFSSEISVGLQ
jgi:hypothetical protein